MFEVSTGVATVANGSIPRRLETIRRVFGMDPTSKETAHLLGTNPASLSRIRKHQGQPRLTRRIAVVAEIAKEIELLLKATAGPDYDATMPSVWLYTTQIYTPDGPQVPFDSLSNIDVARAVLRDLWTFRRKVEEGIIDPSDPFGGALVADARAPGQLVASGT